MTTGKAEVENIDELAKTLEAYAAKVTGEQLKTAVHAGLLLVEGDAKILAPVDEGVLRQSITSESQATGPHAAEGRTGTNVEYGPYQEFGTIHMAPQPFLRPAWDQNAAAVLNEVINTIKGFLGE